MTCPSCGGVVGRDCFNPQECAEIEYQQQMQRQHHNEQMGASILDRMAALEERVSALEQQPAANTQQPNQERKQDQ